ncbi:MAG TPA: HDOD domain-containing protein [Opitutaceae bacterium]|nr:HDOD domain-containing protein [Opitutaceae bacterium]
MNATLRMPVTLVPSSPVSSPYTEAEIRRRLDACPKLASLESSNLALRSLLNAEQSANSQIAEVIRRDPSLSARLLRMVNSVYFGLSARINNIEEAVFFLGLRRIRELSMATPVIEELEKLQPARIPTKLWKDLWSHSVGSAILCREIISTAPVTVDDDTDYLVGLLHNIGKIVMAAAFPDEIMSVANTPLHGPEEVCALEKELIGWDHAQIGSYFLERHQIAEEIVFAVRYHHDPGHAPCHHYFAAAVQVADILARFAGISGGFEQIEPVAENSWKELAGWKILYGENGALDGNLPPTLKRLPAVLKGLV